MSKDYSKGTIRGFEKFAENIVITGCFMFWGFRGSGAGVKGRDVPGFGCCVRAAALLLGP